MEMPAAKSGLSVCRILPSQIFQVYREKLDCSFLDSQTDALYRPSFDPRVIPPSKKPYRNVADIISARTAEGGRQDHPIIWLR